MKVYSLLVALAVALCSATLPSDAVAAPFSIPCPPTGDGLGWTVATGGDFDADGFDDIAIGAPCFYHNELINAGRIIVFSGRTGRRIFQRRGQEEGQFLGLGIGFIPNKNPNGKDRLVIGSPGYDIPEGGDPLNPIPGIINAGKVEVYLQGGGRRLTLVGSDQQGGFGESVAGIEDLNGNAVNDLVIGAGNERNGSGTRTGRIYVVDGDTGEVLSSLLGAKKQARFGKHLAVVGDVDGDDIPDIAAGSDDISIDGVFNSGLVRVMSGLNVEDIISEQSGARNDRLGADVDAAGDYDNDGLADIIVGSFKTDDSGLVQAGAVNIFGADGTVLLSLRDTVPQEKARFGSSVAKLGDVDGDGFPDFAAGAPDHDVLRNILVAATDVGRVLAFSGKDASTLWERDGYYINAQRGSSLAGGIDFNQDGIGDIIIGARGDTPKGRRNAGTATIHSGANGKILRTFRGRHGFETRLYVFSASAGRIIGFDPNGKRKEFRPTVPGRQTGRLSVAVWGDRPRAKPREVQVVAAGGQGAADSKVTVYAAGDRDNVVTEFLAMPPSISGGVNVAAGDVSPLDSLFDRIVAVQANSTDGGVLVRVFRTLDEGVSYFLESEFQAIEPGENWDDVPIPINASGCNVAVGDVLGSSKEEIVVGTITGIPLVRVFDATGRLLNEWLAYDPVDFAGVEVGIVDLRGRGPQIVTVPMSGEPQIKVFNGDGSRALIPGTEDPFFLVPEGAEGAPLARQLTAADVDYDDLQEIVYMTTSADTPAMIVQAFEADTLAPIDFTPFETFDGPTTAIIGTDRFVTN